MSCATHSSISEAEDEAGKEAAIRRSRAGLCLACCGVRLFVVFALSLGSSVERGSCKVGHGRAHSARGADADGPSGRCSRLAGQGQSLGPPVGRHCAASGHVALAMASHAGAEEVGLNELVAALVHQVGR